MSNASDTHDLPVSDTPDLPASVPPDLPASSEPDEFYEFPPGELPTGDPPPDYVPDSGRFSARDFPKGGFPSDDFPPDPRPFVRPQPTAEDREAARILAELIQFGHVPSSLPTLPERWQKAYDDVFQVRTHQRYERKRAFAESQPFDDPYFFVMNEAVIDATPETDDRLEKNRILYHADDALKPPPVLNWVIQDMLARPSLTMLVGNPGTKKTYLAIDLAICVALGKPWLGRNVEQGSAFFVDEETGLHQLWTRFNSALKAHESGWGVPLSFVSLGGYNLRSDAEADELIQRAISLDSRVIIIDALANLMRGTGESNLATIQPVLFNLRRMAEYCNAAVLVIHHTNRHGLFRGSSAISAAVDLMLSIESEPEDSLITLRTLKARFMAPAPFCARANFETAADGSKRFLLTPAEEIPGPPPEVSPLPNPQSGLSFSILEFLTAHPDSTRSQITEQLPQFSEGSVRNVIHQLVMSGQLIRSNDGSKGRKATYALAD